MLNKIISIARSLALGLMLIAAICRVPQAAVKEKGKQATDEAARQAAPGTAKSAAQSTLKDAHLIEPEELAKKISGPKEAVPTIFYVGYAVLFRGGHIPGSQFAGPGATKEGIDQLKSLAYPLALDREIVIYCGCCPFDKCPNILPAYRALLEMGFKRVEILNLPQSFAHDWVEKSLPVVRGRA